MKEVAIYCPGKIGQIPGEAMNDKSVSVYAEAERILNRTLAYQAAIAVHELRDRLDLDVEELRLIVAWQSAGCYTVTCTVVSETLKQGPIEVSVVVKSQPVPEVVKRKLG
jgi:hypothetical protein